MPNVYSHKVHGINYHLTLKQIRDVWSIISDKPGVSFTEIREKTHMSMGKIVAIVDFLKQCGTVTQAKGKSRTLRATVPLLTVHVDAPTHETE